MSKSRFHIRTRLRAAFVLIPALISGPNVLSGKTVELSLSGAPKGTVVVFLSARCPCSASHELALKDLYKEYSAKGFQFVGVHSNADESAELSRGHFGAAQLPFPVLEDPGARLADQLGALKTPHVYLAGPKGELLFQGGVDDSHVAAASKTPFLKQALVAVTEGRRPEIAEARTLGCVIKRP